MVMKFLWEHGMAYSLETSSKMAALRCSAVCGWRVNICDILVSWLLT